MTRFSEIRASKIAHGLETCSMLYSSDTTAKTITTMEALGFEHLVVPDAEYDAALESRSDVRCILAASAIVRLNRSELACIEKLRVGPESILLDVDADKDGALTVGRGSVVSGVTCRKPLRVGDGSIVVDSRLSDATVIHDRCYVCNLVSGYNGLKGKTLELGSACYVESVRLLGEDAKYSFGSGSTVVCVFLRRTAGVLEEPEVRVRFGRDTVLVPDCGTFYKRCDRHGRTMHNTLSFDLSDIRRGAVFGDGFHCDSSVLLKSCRIDVGKDVVFSKIRSTADFRLCAGTLEVGDRAEVLAGRVDDRCDADPRRSGKLRLPGNRTTVLELVDGASRCHVCKLKRTNQPDVLVLGYAR